MTTLTVKTLNTLSIVTSNTVPSCSVSPSLGLPCTSHSGSSSHSGTIS
jgi:hypothetical protein